MTTVWYRSATVACAGFLGAQTSWAAGPGANLGAESSSAVGGWGGLGLWAGIAAVAFLGALVVTRFRRSRSGEPSVTDRTLQRGVIDGSQASMPRGYSAQNVGNDASARPWERNGPSVDVGTAAGSQGGVTLGEAPTDMALPMGFDAEGFIEASKGNFVTLQNAWDRSDVACLRAMMTDGMLEQIQGQLAEREKVTGSAAASSTEVVMLDAHLVGVEEQGDNYMASVEFSGLLREDPSAGPNPFRELWSITRPKSAEGGWLVAGVQALQ